MSNADEPNSTNKFPKFGEPGFFELIRKKIAEAQLDVPEERLKMKPYLGGSNELVFYEDPWIKATIANVDGNYQLEWKVFHKDRTTVKTLHLPEVTSITEAGLDLRQRIRDYWTSGLLHPLNLNWGATGYVPPTIENLFKPIEEARDSN